MAGHASGREGVYCVILCCIGRVPTDWWPHGVFGALWTRRPIVEFAMMCRTEPAMVHIARVLRKLHFFFNFPFFFSIITQLTAKKNYTHRLFFPLVCFFFCIFTRPTE